MNSLSIENALSAMSLQMPKAPDELVQAFAKRAREVKTPPARKAAGKANNALLRKV